MIVLEKGLRTIFRTPFEQHSAHDGQPCEVVRAITEPDDRHDSECLPMFVIRFDDGTEIEAWPEEINEGDGEALLRTRLVSA